MTGKWRIMIGSWHETFEGHGQRVGYVSLWLTSGMNLLDKKIRDLGGKNITIRIIPTIQGVSLEGPVPI